MSCKMFIDHIKHAIAENGWMLVWAVFAVSLIFAWHDHRDGVEKIKATTGKAKRKAVSKLFFLWAVPIVACIAAIGTQIASDEAENTIKNLTSKVQPRTISNEQRATLVASTV